jgi:hypothetical protein
MGSSEGGEVQIWAFRLNLRCSLSFAPCNGTASLYTKKVAATAQSKTDLRVLATMGQASFGLWRRTAERRLCNLDTLALSSSLLQNVPSVGSEGLWLGAVQYVLVLPLMICSATSDLSLAVIARATMYVVQ